MKINQNKNWIVYVIGVLVIGFLLMLNSVTANNISQDLKGTIKGEMTEYTPRLSLPKGEYMFTCGGSGEYTVVTPDGKELSKGKGGEKVTVKLDKDESNIIIKTTTGTVSNVKIESKHAIFNDTLWISLLLIVLLLYIGYIRFRKQADFKSSAVVLMLIVASVFATYPVLCNYISFGQDLNFHLYRIEGIKDGLLSGQFPVRIDPTHNNGYGYITASVYPNLFLYFPALLRLCGISLVISYKTFLFATNLATALIMYICTKKLTKSTFAGVFSSIVYTLSSWRIINLIYRAAIGEALAMTFLPIVILGLYYILKGDKSKWWVFALGCSAVFNSHIISCIFVAILSVIVVIVFWRDFISDKRYMGFVKAAVLIILLNLWYLIPFMVYYLGFDLSIHHTPVNTEYFNHAIFPAQLFNLINNLFGGEYLLDRGMKDDMSMSLGVGVAFCLVIAAVYFIFKRKRKLKNYRFYAVIFMYAVLLLFMSTTLFPSELFQKWKLFNSVIAGTVRMPLRYLGLASPFIVIVAAAVVEDKIKLSAHKKGVIAAAIVISIVTLLPFGSAYIKSFDATVTKLEAVPTEISAGWDNEYFPAGTDIDKLTPCKYTVSNNSVSVLNYEKNGTNIVLELSGAKDNEYVEVPLLYYPGYSARTSNGEKLEVGQGDNNVLRVNLTDGADSIKIKYSGFVIFKISCIISLLTVVLMLFYIYYKRKGLKIGYSKRKN